MILYNTVVVSTVSSSSSVDEPRFVRHKTLLVHCYLCRGMHALSLTPPRAGNDGVACVTSPQSNVCECLPKRLRRSCVACCLPRLGSPARYAPAPLFLCFFAFEATKRRKDKDSISSRQRLRRIQAQKRDDPLCRVSQPKREETSKESVASRYRVWIQR